MKAGVEPGIILKGVADCCFQEKEVCGGDACLGVWICPTRTC